MIPNSNIRLGDRVKDKVTGFEGIVTVWCETYTGNQRIQVEGKATDESSGHYLQLDVQQVEAVEVQVVKPTEENGFSPSYKLGDKVEDMVTGRKGIVVAFNHFLNGCVHAEIGFPPEKDGRDMQTAPWQQYRLEKTDALKLGGETKEAKKKSVGGPAKRGTRFSQR
tara:strand:+ start:388 stop:885 length:498 start_codon:yes stop_codon:yes gene_type:complete